MGISILNENDYYRIVYGGWLGKNIGGTLGAPVEGRKELLSLTFYPKLPDGPLENDDLDLQLVWLHALEQYGPSLTARELGQEWTEHVFFPFDEYGYALANLRRGLLPPVAGWFGNPFTNCMGSPIRSEIWAMAAPGAPEVAARYAYEDAIVDHAGGEGVYGEMFFAALESAVFMEKDRDRLIEIGLTYIPQDCRTALALRDLIRWHKEGYDWKEARELVLKHHGHSNFTDAPQNIAFTILGWLYGESFEDAILKAVNCGYDTDCTAATLGAILGMLLGPDALPEKWVAPVGERVVVSPPIKGFPAPKNLDELTKRTIRMGKQILAAWDTGIIVHPDLPTSWNREDGAAAPPAELWERGVTGNRYRLPQGTIGCPDAELTVDYGPSGPAIGAGQATKIAFRFTNRSGVPLEGSVALVLPEGWSGSSAQSISLEPGESLDWEAEIRASNDVRSVNRLEFVWSRSHDHSPWNEQRVAFTLVRASSWHVSGPDGGEAVQAFMPGNRLDWSSAVGEESDGVYTARTTMRNPARRQMRIIAAANAPVTLRLNGEDVIECKETLAFMPAFHRAPRQQWFELELDAGDHEIEVEAVRGGNPLEVYVLPVSTRQTTSPGAFYYYTDVLWGV
ncbi:ADP-ribosylglycohydrolase family protein [Paenibacillus ginsengarvi]|uniref:ADP-ribosylglycohydrolase family protein n=1 Tax=Paenibacillus ginsengarvi TaxID=400777 RepID=UPI0013156CD4|nr:ADP-ribosylglycohydrolase family protein [Paenibacillus ginsengarvi]